MKRIIFHLKRLWKENGETVDLWNQILTGKKTSEWRDDTPYWRSRLLNPDGTPKVYVAWFVVGYPKNNKPRIEAPITNITVYPKEYQNPRIQIQFAMSTEVKE